MSRLDRFLVSNDWLDLYPEVKLALPKPSSDLCPVLLDSNRDRWGPAPFQFELMWLEEKEFSHLIGDWRKNIEVEVWAGHRLAVKLKIMKQKIKDWSKSNFVEVEASKSKILEEIQDLDQKEERKQISSEERLKRSSPKEEFERKVIQEEIKWRQPSRGNWLKETKIDGFFIACHHQGEDHI